MTIFLRLLLLVAGAAVLLFPVNGPAAGQERQIRVAVVGLVHGHAKGFFAALPKNDAAKLVAIVEPQASLVNDYTTQFKLDPKLFYSDIEKMLIERHPDAVLVYTTIADHRKVIEIAAKHGVSAMVEKPLATTLDDAIAIQRAAKEHNVTVLVNYETTWYPSNWEAFREVNIGKLGEIRRVVVHDGHEGPVEIKVEPEFLSWLTDPEKNGAGALFDFGCYGADLMTVLMHGEVPERVWAAAQTNKPDLYPHVDDDATIILQYPKTQAVLMPSWNWSFSRKDMEIYGVKGYAITVGRDHLRVRYHGADVESTMAALDIPRAYSNSLDYLAAVLNGRVKPNGDLSSLETNMVVMQILDAALRSSKEGGSVTVKKLVE